MLSKLAAMIKPELTTALQDLDSVCSRNNIWYLVGGSVAVVAVTDDHSVSPQDVDAVLDIKDKEKISNSLKEIGYKLINLDQSSVVNRSKEHFEKEGRKIELAFGYFTDKGFQIPLPVKIPGLKLMFGKTMAVQQRLSLNGVSFFGFSREATFVSLDGLMTTIEKMGDRVEKRKRNYELLSKGLDKSKIEQIAREKPGIYFYNIPLVTPKNKILLKLANPFIK